MSTTGKLFKSASMMAIVTLLSKFLGFFREIFIASKFGSGYETDTYIVAMTATYLIMGMVAGAFNTVLVPIFSEIDEEHGKERSVKFLNNTLNIMFFISIGAMVVFYFLSPVAISILGNGFEGKQFELAVKLNRIGLPIVLGMSFSFIFSGFLQSRERFFAPSATGFPFNIVQIIFLLTLSSVFGIEGLMVALVLAIFGQVIIQIPPAIKEGFKYRWIFDTKDKYVRKMLYLTLPVMLGTAIQQVNIIVDRALASRLAEGSISSLSYAARVNEIILGIFVTAITTAIFPILSKAATQKDIKSLVRVTKGKHADIPDNNTIYRRAYDTGGACCKAFLRERGFRQRSYKDDLSGSFLLLAGNGGNGHEAYGYKGVLLYTGHQVPDCKRALRHDFKRSSKSGAYSTASAQRTCACHKHFKHT